MLLVFFFNHEPPQCLAQWCEKRPWCVWLMSDYRNVYVDELMKKQVTILASPWWFVSAGFSYRMFIVGNLENGDKYKNENNNHRGPIIKIWAYILLFFMHADCTLMGLCIIIYSFL